MDVGCNVGCSMGDSDIVGDNVNGDNVNGRLKLGVEVVIVADDDGVATVVVHTGDDVGLNNNEDFIVGIRVGSCMDILGLCVGISLGLRLSDGS